jgi:hypothetical protein
MDDDKHKFTGGGVGGGIGAIGWGIQWNYPSKMFTKYVNKNTIKPFA